MSEKKAPITDDEIVIRLRNRETILSIREATGAGYRRIRNLATAAGIEVRGPGGARPDVTGTVGRAAVERPGSAPFVRTPLPPGWRGVEFDFTHAADGVITLRRDDEAIGPDDNASGPTFLDRVVSKGVGRG